MSHLNASVTASFGIKAFGSQMARRDGDYLIARRFADRGNDTGVFYSRARGEDRCPTRRVADRGSGGVCSDPRDLKKIKRLQKRVRDLERQQEIKWLRQRIRDLEAATWKETELESPVGDEEYPSNGELIYDSPPVFDDYGDEEDDIKWGKLFVGVDFLSSSDCGTTKEIRRVNGKSLDQELTEYTRMPPSMFFDFLKEDTTVKGSDRKANGGGHAVMNDDPFIACGAQTGSMVTHSFMPEVMVGLEVDGATITDFQLAGDNLIIQKDKRADNMDIVIVNNSKISLGNTCGPQSLSMETLNEKGRLNVVRVKLNILDDFFGIQNQWSNNIILQKINSCIVKINIPSIQENADGPFTHVVVISPIETREVGTKLFEQVKSIVDGNQTNASLCSGGISLIHIKTEMGKDVVVTKSGIVLNKNGLNVPFDPGGICLESGETKGKLEPFRRVVMIWNKNRVDVPFDPGGFIFKPKLEDEFFSKTGSMMHGNYN